MVEIETIVDLQRQQGAGINTATAMFLCPIILHVSHRQFWPCMYIIFRSVLLNYRSPKLWCGPDKNAASARILQIYSSYIVELPLDTVRSGIFLPRNPYRQRKLLVECLRLDSFMRSWRKLIRPENFIEWSCGRMSASARAKAGKLEDRGSNLRSVYKYDFFNCFFGWVFRGKDNSHFYPASIFKCC